VIDPSKGGAVSPKTAQQEARALEADPGVWPWDGLVRLLEVDLFSPAWETRHGAAMALRELLKAQGACGGMRDSASFASNAVEHERWCDALATKLLCIFVLDRFGDFVSDQVVAPVRETASQTLAALLLHMPERGARHVHALLLQMVRQDFPLPARVKAAPPPSLAVAARRGAPRHVTGQTQVHMQQEEPAHVWEVRHAGLLGIKYEVAVRPDLVGGAVKSENGVKMEEGSEAETARASLRDVVDAAILG
jgi:TATA-binding protein-associated factor